MSFNHFLINLIFKILDHFIYNRGQQQIYLFIHPPSHAYVVFGWGELNEMSEKKKWRYNEKFEKK